MEHDVKKIDFDKNGVNDMPTKKLQLGINFFVNQEILKSIVRKDLFKIYVLSIILNTQAKVSVLR